jgi:uncharacterized membrane protein
VFVAIILGYFAIKIVLSLVIGIVAMVLPVAIVGVVAYVLYSAISGRPMLGGRRRTLL